MLFTAITILYFFNVGEPLTYNSGNAIKMFDFYKEKYNKQYSNKIIEENGLKNFIKNLNTVNSLNENATDKSKLYQLNRYADTDPKEFESHFGVEINPYDNVFDTTSGKLLRSEKPDYLAHTSLYDLAKANEAFKTYLNKYNKNYSTKQDRKLHYYKFVKSLVQINRARMKGEPLFLDEYSDVIDAPNEYFY